MAKLENTKDTKTAAEFWDDLDDFDTCMLVTNDGRQLRSRPMAPHLREDAGEIRFLTSIKTHKVDELEANPNANVVFADDGEFISVSGAIRISQAPADIDELWSASAEAWLDEGKAEAAVLILDASEGEYWESAGTLKATWETAKAALTGERPGVGTSGKLAL